MIVMKVIEGLNSLKENKEVEWKINSFDEKRTIAGFKARIEWNCPGKDMRLTFKISFASTYFRLINHLNEGDIFVEIEELNFVLSNQEKKELQERVEKILASSIEAIRGKTYNDESKKQSDCLKRFLQDVNVPRPHPDRAPDEGLRRQEEEQRAGRQEAEQEVHALPRPHHLRLEPPRQHLHH
jgi:hypothetical protein